jgi:hypothetical protein
MMREALSSMYPLSSQWPRHRLYMLNVLDLVSQVRDVILVRCIFSSGEPQGVRILEWGVYGKGLEMGRSVYEQPGTKVDGILSQHGGFQVSRRETKGGKKKWKKEKTEARGLHRNYVVR